MNVEHILSVKGGDVVTIRIKHTMSEAASILAERRIGAVVVVDEQGVPLGIISERDIVKALGKRGQAVLDEDVSEHMTSKIVTCHRQSGITELMGVMTDGKFRHIPVIEGGRLIGIISIGDLVKHRLAEMEAEHQAMHEYITTA
jgi:CBS domain-containing protein